MFSQQFFLLSIFLMIEKLSNKFYMMEHSAFASKLNSNLFFTINPNQAGEGQICPRVFQALILLEPNVGLTSNQAVNSSLSIV